MPTLHLLWHNRSLTLRFAFRIVCGTWLNSRFSEIINHERKEKGNERHGLSFPPARCWSVRFPVPWHSLQEDGTSYLTSYEYMVHIQNTDTKVLLISSVVSQKDCEFIMIYACVMFYSLPCRMSTLLLVTSRLRLQCMRKLDLNFFCTLSERPK